MLYIKNDMYTKNDIALASSSSSFSLLEVDKRNPLQNKKVRD